METDYDRLLQILQICLRMDHSAHAIYNKFAESNPDPAMTEFWNMVAKEEKEHMRFWGKAIVLCRKKHFPIAMENLTETGERLVHIEQTLNSLISTFHAYGSPAEEIMLAYTLESYLFDPAFMSIFNSFKFIDESINENYETHILKFVDIMRHCNNNTAPARIEILGETLHNLYQLNKKLSHESYTDTLTGLLNRRGFFNTINPYVKFASRNQQKVGIIMTDLDNFKKINENYGHPAGDEALRTAAALIRTSLRQTDIAGRYGGEEFIIFTPAQDLKSLELICERIRKNIDAKSKKLTGIHFSISLGAANGAILPPEEESLSALIEEADKMLGQAKLAGKNCFRI